MNSILEKQTKALLIIEVDKLYHAAQPNCNTNSELNIDADGGVAAINTDEDSSDDQESKDNDDSSDDEATTDGDDLS